MCEGGRFLADFVAGTVEQPQVPAAVEECLTQTADGVWVVWARKVARVGGMGYFPLTGHGSYPADAVAQCRKGGQHQAPDPCCTCGFHAVSAHPPGVGAPMVQLDVALSGRVLAMDWMGGGVLFRAARQTVMRTSTDRSFDEEPRWFRRPDEEPGGRLARLVGETPRGAGSLRLSLPEATPPAVDIGDDAGYCRVSAPTISRQPAGVLTSV
jgi:hypothetical protein